MIENEIIKADAQKLTVKQCGTCRFYYDGICGSIHGMNGKICKGDYCSHHDERRDAKDDEKR